MYWWANLLLKPTSRIFVEGASPKRVANSSNFLCRDPTENRLVADFENDVGGGNNPVQGTPGEISVGVWHHAAATYDQPSGTWFLYLDGDLHGTATTGGAVPESDSIQHCGIGAALASSGWTAAGSGAFSGEIDEVRVWNRALDRRRSRRT